MFSSTVTMATTTGEKVKESVKCKTDTLLSGTGGEQKPPAAHSSRRKSKMLTVASSSATSSSSTSSDTDLLRELVAKLQGELDVERNLRREQSHAHQVKSDQQAAKASVATKELRAKLLADYKRELDLQRESLQRKHEHELGKAVKHRESETGKLTADLNKCQAELAQYTGSSGLSAQQRHAFEAERARLTAETQELRGQKRRLEDLVRTAQAAQKHMAKELRQAGELHAADVAKIRRESDMEIKKLLEELKGKERTIGTLKKDTGVVQAEAKIAKQQELIITMATELSMIEHEKRDEEAMSESTDSALSLGSSLSTIDALSLITEEEVSGVSEATEAPAVLGTDKGPPPDRGKQPHSIVVEMSGGEEVKSDGQGDQGDGVTYIAMTELRVKLRKTEEVVAGLSQDKADVLKRMKDLEAKFKQSQEKNRKFLDKNMELTNMNRSLEEKTKKLNEDNAKLKISAEKSKREAARLNSRLSVDKQGKLYIDSLTEEIGLLKGELDQANKAINSLSLSCQEKDRRIELLAQRRKKQRGIKPQHKVVRFSLPNDEKKPSTDGGLKETYYGYDEDSRSVASSASVSSSQGAISSQDSQQNNMADRGHVADDFPRDEFEKNYQRLAKEHMELEKSFTLLQGSHGYVDPQREVKLRSQLEEDLLAAQTHIEQLENTVKGEAQKTKEKDAIWLKEKEKLNKSIRKLKEKLSAEEAAIAKLKSSVQQLKEQNEVLEFRLFELEDCNEKLVEELAGVREEDVTAGETDLSSMDDLKDLTDMPAPSERALLLRLRLVLDVTQRRVHQLTEERNDLAQRLASLEKAKANSARASEENADLVLEYEAARNQLDEANKRIEELTVELSEENQRLAVCQYKQVRSDQAEQKYRNEIAKLRRHLEGQQKEAEPLENMERQNSEVGVEERARKLIEELNHVKVRLEESEHNEGELTEQNLSMQDELETLHKRCNILGQELDLAEEELEAAHRKCGHLEQEVELSNQKCTSTERELQLACLALEKLKTGGEGDFDSATVLQKNTEEKQVLQREVKELREALEIKDRQVFKLSQSNDEFQQDEEDLTYLKEHIELKEQDIEELKSKVEKLQQTENESYEKILELLEVKDQLEVQLGELKEKEGKDVEIKKKLKAQVRELSEENEKEKDEKKRLQTQVATDDLDLDLPSLSANQSECNIPEHEKLTNEIAAYKENMAKLQTEVAMQKLAQAAQNQEKKPDETSKEIAAQKETIAKLQTEIAMLKLSRVAEKQESGGESSSESAAQKDTIAKLKRDNAMLKLTKAAEKQGQETSETSNEAAAQKETIAKLKRENAMLKLTQVAEKKEKKEEETDEKVNELTTENAAQKETIAKLKRENAMLKLTQVVEKKEKKEEETVETASELATENAAQKETIAKLKRENAMMKLSQVAEKKEKKQVRIDENPTEMTSGAANYKETIARLQTENAMLKLAQVAEKQDKKDETSLRGTIKELEKDLEQARTQFEEAHAEFERHDAELQKKIKTLETEIVELQGESDENMNITLYEEKIEALEKDLQEVQENEKKLKKAETDHDQRVDELQAKLQAMEENEQKLGETIEDLKEIETSLKGKITETEMEITDREKFAEEREELKSQVAELEKKLKEAAEQKTRTESDKVQKYEQQMTELMDRVEELTVKESELMKEVYQQKMENQELQDNLEEVLDEKLEAENSNEVEELQSKLNQLQEEHLALTEQVLKGKQADIEQQKKLVTETGQQLQDRVQELEQNEHDLKQSIQKANGEIEALNVQLQEGGDKTKELLDKLEVLEISEARLMEQLDSAEERNAQLSTDLFSYQDQEMENQEDAENSKHREKELLDEIERLKAEMNQGLETTQQQEGELSNKVDSLVEAEGKLVQKLQQHEEIEAELRGKIGTLEAELKSKQSVDEATQTNEQRLKKEIQRLETEGTEQQAQINSLRGTLSEYETSNADLNQTVSKLKHMESTQKYQINELKETESALKAQVSELEQEKEELTESVAEKLKSKPPPILISSSNALAHDSSFASATAADTSADLTMFSTAAHAFVPLDPAQIQKMSREEMMSKIQELQSMESYHRTKIGHLTENLDELRNAVEVVAVTMETDAGIPIVKYRPKIKDSEFEARLQELVKSESAMKIRVMDLEKKETQMKRDLNAAEAMLKEQEQDYKDELDELEDELNEIRKSEAKLRNKLQYGQNSPVETPALAKIQHLEELVFDLETSENKLKRQLQETQRNEQELQEKLTEIESSRAMGSAAGAGVERVGWEEKERQFTQEQRLKDLAERNEELEEEVQVLRKDDTHEKLAKHVSELQRTEKGLRLKVTLLEAQQSSSSSVMDALGSGMFDTPEDLLRQRIRELEKMEQHMGQQVAELERDREELHEIARGDKNTIHELSVQVRELQLRDKTLKEQLNRCEQSESLLQLKCDDLAERKEELEEKLQQVQASEHGLRAKLAKHEHTHNDLSIQLEHSQEDLQSAESKLRKRIEELQEDKRELRVKCDELTDRIGDLEGAELTYRQKLRTTENNEAELRRQVHELESREGKNEQRCRDLEHINDTLNDKLHTLEEEKANLLYTISDLEITKEENSSDVLDYKSKMAATDRKLAETEKRKTELESRLDEFTQKEVNMHSRLGETERKGREMQDSLEQKTAAESRLKQKLEELEAQYVATDEKVKSAEAFEKQLNFLRNQIEYHQRTHAQIEAENQRLKDRVQRYEHATATKTMVQIPTAELQMLRDQEKVLDELEGSVARLEASEKSLKAAVEKLREGKDACGHEFELRELESKIAENHTLSQAHELLKENHEESRQELTQIKSQLKNRGGAATSSKSIQAHLAETINLKGLNPEFKTALKSLGAQYPEAYEEFVHHLQPSSTSSNTSHVRITTTEADTDPTMRATKEPVITATALDGPDGPAASASSGTPLPPGTIQPQPQRPHDRSAEDRTALICELADAMTVTERPLWREVEGKKSSAVRREDDDYWEQLEKNMGDTDDMMLTINFGAEEDSPSRPRSATSMDSSSSLPPPLPGTQPPPRLRSQSPGGGDPYYPPSADEASELDNDYYGASSLRPLRAGSRARSLDPDSAFWDSSASTSRQLPTLGIGASSHKRGGGGKTKKISASLDSIPDDSGFQDVEVKILREKITRLEDQVKVKEQEVKVIKEELMEKENNEMLDLQAKLRERDNQLAKEKKRTTDQQDKLSRTAEELDQIKEEMDRVKAKSIIPASSASSTGPITTDIPLLKAQLERKEREVNAKNNEVDRLSKELRGWQEDCRDARDSKEKAEDSLRSLESRVQQLQDDSERLQQLDQEHRALLKENEELKARLNYLESTGEDKATLEKIVLKLRGQLAHLEAIQLERNQLEAKVKSLEEQLREKSKQESRLAQNNSQLKHQLDDVQQQKRDYGLMEEDYNKVRSKFNEMEQLKTKAQLAITPLRAKVLRLSSKCKAKDDVLNEVAAAVHSGAGVPADVQRRMESIVAESASEEYHRPISPVTTQALQDFETECNNTSLPPSPLLSHHHAPHVVLEGAPRDQEHPHPSTSHHHHRRPHSLETSSESEEVDEGELPTTYMSLQPVSQLHHPSASASASNSHSPSRAANGRHGAKYQNGGLGVVPMLEMYKAIKDYQPEHFSRSGHQRLELSMKEGDVVKALGPPDDKGYFEAQVGGKVGLVPMSYLMPLPTPPSRPPPGRKVTRPFTGVNSSPEQILEMHQQLQHTHTPNHHVASPPSTALHPPLPHGLLASSATGAPSSRQNGIVPSQARHHAAPLAPVPGRSVSPRMDPPTRPLAPPTDLRVHRVVGDHSLLLAWTPPLLDELARNNGTTVRGYKIFIDSKDRQSIPSPHMTKALVERLDLRRPHSFSIQSIGESGRVSALSDTVMFEDVLEASEDDGAEGMSIASSMTEPGLGERKVHVALYDYIPSPSAPHPHQHIPFNAGDIVVTYGPARPDGLHNGKVHGKKGLVPASFIEEVAILKSKGRRSMSIASSSNTSMLLSAADHLSTRGSNSTTPLHSMSRHSLASSSASTTASQRRGTAHRV